MRTFALKAGATLVTVATTVLSALYVTAHLKNSAAPLRPAVLSQTAGTTVTALGGSLTIGPSVQTAGTQPSTSTYAS